MNILIALTILHLFFAAECKENCICYEPIISNLTNPLSMVFLNKSHAILAEHHGLISWVNLLEKSTTIIADLRKRVVYNNSRSETGLLGLAIDSPPKSLFVSYSRNATLPSRQIDHETVVYKYQFDANSLKVSPNPQLILNISQPTNCNNGGHLFFDDKGGLYLANGDGGGNGTEREPYLGKILRIDTQNDNIEIKIFAAGFVNPWRCSFDKIDDRMFCGDVGRNGEERIFIVKENADHGTDKLPIHIHKIGEQPVVIGGFYYTGRKIPFLYENYVFGDYNYGTVHALKHEGSAQNQWKHVQILSCSYCQLRHHILAFSQDNSGNIYVLTSTDDENGIVYKLIDPCYNQNNYLGKFKKLSKSTNYS